MTKVLLSMIGSNDCSVEKPGAILSILKEIRFDKVYLLYNHDKYLKAASDIFKYCQKYHPEIQIVYKSTPIENPTDYNTVYPAMYASVQDIVRENVNAKFTVSITSGTPTMHACWIFLQQGGVIHAKLIQIQRETGISEVNFNLDDFPEIKQIDQIKVELTKLSRENRLLKNRKLAYDNIIGECPEILQLKEQIKLFADSDISVFVHGESGTGKELVAEALHYNSPRKEKTFIKVNCGAISPELFESEFFGHKKGSFTGAVADKEGKFKLADCGTIFLDEICDLPDYMQTKLLRVLQEGTFIPVGGIEEEKVDVRTLSATNKDIMEQVRQKKFREDLFYRIVSCKIHLPPLRTRDNDKILLSNYFVEKFNQKQDKNKFLSQSAINLINVNPWQGNIRQLKNAIEAAFVYPDEEIKAEHLNIIDFDKSSDFVEIPGEGFDFDGEIVLKFYHAALKKTGGNAEKAAQLLGIKPHTFRARLRKLGIET
ncbi:MAG: sigma-54 dependent transcriptional regulator [bacterium]